MFPIKYQTLNYFDCPVGKRQFTLLSKRQSMYICVEMKKKANTDMDRVYDYGNT